MPSDPSVTTMDDKIAEITQGDLNLLKRRAAANQDALKNIGAILATSMKPKKKLKKISLWLDVVNIDK